MEDIRNTKMSLAIIAGLAAGAAVYYFMNSKNGKQQWNTLVDLAKDFTDKLKTSSLETTKNVSNHVSNGASMFTDSAKN